LPTTTTAQARRSRPRPSTTRYFPGVGASIVAAHQKGLRPAPLGARDQRAAAGALDLQARIERARRCGDDAQRRAGARHARAGQHDDVVVAGGTCGERRRPRCRR